MDLSNLPPRSTGYWSAYQKQIFQRGGQEEQLPPFNTQPSQLEALAQERLSLRGWRYAASNAGLSHTHDANRDAFSAYRIIPRMARDVTCRDTTVEIFGHKLNAPIAFAPVGINVIYHEQGEIPVASVAGQLGLAYALSTAGSNSIEDVAASNDKGVKEKHTLPIIGAPDNSQDIGKAIRWFQLYMPHDQELGESLMKRAVDSGFTACIMTLDTWQLAWRHDDIASANYAFYRGIGNQLGFSDPVFQKRLKEKGIDPKADPKKAGELWIDQVWHGHSFNWNDIKNIMATWKKISGGKPFCVKGIQSVDDARKAVEIGVDGIVVSNHAGRQVDGAVGSLEQLPEIVDAVGDKTVIMFDSGVRGGADVFKALALGAKLVFIGRLWIYGLAIQGRTGVEHVLRSLLADFDLTMEMTGAATIKDITRDYLKKSDRSYNTVSLSGTPGNK